MSGTTTHPKGVLLVGSVPLSDTETVLHKCSTALSSHVRYLPDGETGIRGNFVAWQLGKLGAAPEVMSPFGDWGKATGNTVTQEQKQAAAKKLENLATDYDTVNIESYQTFKKLKEQGVVPKHVKFQVCLPSPLTTIGPFVNKEYKEVVEPIYEDAIMRALENITKTIPAEDLALQWDIPIEFALLEGVMVEPWFEPIKEGIMARIVRLGDAVDPKVEMGFHICYGDIMHQHFTQPKDMRLMVDVATGLLKSINRKINYLHMPVPKERDDAEYFAALKDLQAVRGDTDIYLGVVHANDPEGTQRRIKAASEVLGEFGVGTECGLGRTSPEDIDSIFEISKSVSDKVI